MNYTLIWRVKWALDIFVIAEMWGFNQPKEKVLEGSFYNILITVKNVGLRFEFKSDTQKLSLIRGFPHKLVPLKMLCTSAFKDRWWGLRSLILTGQLGYSQRITLSSWDKKEIHLW